MTRYQAVVTASSPSRLFPATTNNDSKNSIRSYATYCRDHIHPARLRLINRSDAISAAGGLQAYEDSGPVICGIHEGRFLQGFSELSDLRPVPVGAVTRR
jgi:hypothetical protein